MFCVNCGKEIDEQAVFCPHCGAGVEAERAGDGSQSNGMAVAGFVCSFLSPILGWIFGGIGLSRAKKRNGKGYGLSVASIAVASVNFVLGLLIF